MAIKVCLLVEILALAHIALSIDTTPRDTVEPSLLWGPYRPNLYFGIRPRIPQSLLMGLMWTRTQNGTFEEKTLRHGCEQSDGMAGYGWDEYDPRTGGSQTIYDVGNSIDVRTDFFKPKGDGSCCQWAVRINGTPRADAPKDLESLVVFYIGSEDPNPTEDSFLDCAEAEGLAVMKCSGNQRHVPSFTLQFQEPQRDNVPVQRGYAASIRSDSVPADGIWQAKCT